MTVASAAHRANGPLAAKGGFELPLTNLAATAALAAAGPGRLKIGPPLPRPLTTAATAIGGLMAAGSLAKMARAARAAGAAQASSPVAESSADAQSPQPPKTAPPGPGRDLVADTRPISPTR